MDKSEYLDTFVVALTEVAKKNGLICEIDRNWATTIPVTRLSWRRKDGIRRQVSISIDEDAPAAAVFSYSCSAAAKHYMEDAHFLHVPLECSYERLVQSIEDTFEQADCWQLTWVMK